MSSSVFGFTTGQVVPQLSPEKRGNSRIERSEGIGSLTPVTSTLLHLAPLPHIRTFHVTAQHVIMSGHRAWEIQLLPLCQTPAIILMYAIVMFLKSEKMCLLVPSLFFRPVFHLHFNLCVLDTSCSFLSWTASPPLLLTILHLVQHWLVGG